MANPAYHWPYAAMGKHESFQRYQPTAVVAS
jgi:hypothetical protein